MLALLKYNYKINIKSNKFIIPFLNFCLFQIIFYSTDAVNFTASIIVCANVVFCIMIWMSFSYCETEDWLTEQSVFLKVKNDRLYWISKILFMWIVGIIISLIGIVWPLTINLLKNGDLFHKEVILNDVLLGFFIQILVALMGVLLGMIFQTKVIRNRNKAVMILCFITLLSIIKGPLIKEFPIAKVITWILPPVYDVISSCMGLGNFSLSLLAIPVLYGVVYILIQIFVYIKLMKKLLF